MAVAYHVYSSGASGGPVNLAAPVASVSTLSWASGALPTPCTITYLVRPYDTATGLENANGDARVTVKFDALGDSLDLLPNAPTGLTATPRVGGSARVAWSYAPGGQGAAPSGFHVYAWPEAGSPNYAAPAAAVAFTGSSGSFAATLSGLTGGTTYRVAVRAYNAAGEETNANSVPLAAVTTGPTAVAALTASAVP
jgi:hypothetical protein